jgi:hypothetical protein
VKATIGVILVCSVISTAILVKFAQVGLEVQGAAQEASANPIKALLNLFRTKPTA